MSWPVFFLLYTVFLLCLIKLKQHHERPQGTAAALWTVNFTALAALYIALSFLAEDTFAQRLVSRGLQMSAVLLGVLLLVVRAYFVSAKEDWDCNTRSNMAYSRMAEAPNVD